MYPSTLTSFTYPQPTDRLNSPSHTSIHAQIASNLGQLQAFIGTTSSTVGTLIYDIRSANSDGGGHVQTAVKGGTGQTTFTKGDLIVAINASTLSKLATGIDNQVLTANSSTASGLNWANPLSGRIGVNASVISIRTPSTTESSLISTTVPGSTIGLNNAIRAKSYINFQSLGNGASIMLQANYGGSPVASVIFVPVANLTSMFGTAEVVIAGTNSHTAQRVVMEVVLKKPYNAAAPSTSVIAGYTMKTAAVSSGANQTFGMTVRPIVAGTDVDVDITTVEKIT